MLEQPIIDEKEYDRWYEKVANYTPDAQTNEWLLKEW